MTTPRPLRRDAEMNRRRILEAAKAVFGTRGLEASLDDIAHHAGLGVGTVYRRFPGKEHLIEAMFADRLDEIGALAAEHGEAEDPWAGFTAFIWQVTELHANDRGLREIMLSNAYGREQVLEAKARMLPRLTRLFDRAQASGQLRADADVTDMPLMLRMVGSVVEYAGAVQPEIWRRCLALLLDSLRAQPGAATELPQPPLDVPEIAEAMEHFRAPRQ